MRRRDSRPGQIQQPLQKEGIVYILMKDLGNAVIEDLLGALAGSGCPICRLAREHDRLFIDSMMARTPAQGHSVITELTASSGFCVRHGTEWVLEGDCKRSTPIVEWLLRDLKVRLSQDVGKWAPPSVTLLSTGERRPGRGFLHGKRMLCPACESWHDREKTYLIILLEHIQDMTVYDMFRRSDGLCLIHLEDTVELARCGRVRQFRSLEALEVEILNRLLRDVRNAKLAVRHHLPKDAWIRGVEKLSNTITDR